MPPKSYRLLCLLLCGMLTLGGCIIVVEEDDDWYHDDLHGTSWYLEVIWVHGHRHRAADQSFAISFPSERELTGNSGCTSFTADYDLSDKGIRFDRFRTSTFGCQEDEVGGMLLEYLPEAENLQIQDERLEFTTDSGTRLVFRP